MQRNEDAPARAVGRRLLLAALLAAVGVGAYLPIAHAGFVWDDDSFLTGNALIRASDGLRRFWLTTQPNDYWPVTSSTLWLEWRLWGMHAAGYHLTNLTLHIGEGLLLWAVLRRLRVPGAYLAALLFTVHPVNVESVAWIAQRKNLMAMLFSLLSVLWFAAGTKAASETAPVSESRLFNRWLCLSLGAFVLAMLSKGSVATLPAVLALLLWWRGRLVGREWLRLVPFLLVAVLLAAVNVWFQRHGALSTIRSASSAERFLGAGAVVWFYLYKAIWPVSLVFIYPAWQIHAADPLWWIPLIAAVTVTAFLWRHRNDWGRPLLVAWDYFVLTLIPVLGFTDVYFMKYSLVADHYQHLALIGVVALAGAGWARWEHRVGGLWPRAAAAGLVICFAALTFRQCGHYADLETLYRSILEKNPSSWIAHNNLGILLQNRGHTDEAIGHYREALRLKPDYAEAHIDLGNALLQLGKPEEAVMHFDAALAVDSDYAREAHLNLGHAWFQTGNQTEAVAEYRAALKIDPEYSEAHFSLGNAFYSLGHFEAAVTEFRAALKTAPEDADALNNLGSALVRAGRPREAIPEYERALRLRPGDASTIANLKRAQSAAEAK